MKKKFAFIVLLSMSMILTACGSSSSSQANHSSAGPAQKGAANTAQANGAANAQAVQRKLVANAKLSLTVKEYESSEQKIRDLASSMNGYVVNSSSSEYSDEKSGTLVLRVPADKLQSFLDQLKKLNGVEISSSEMTSQDVTSQYIDLDARLKALHAEGDRLNALLQKASTVDEILKINTEVSKVQEQIEQAQGQINYLQHNVDFSEVTLSMSSSGRVKTEKQQGALARAGSTFASNLGGVGDFFVGLFVFIIGYFPTLLLLFLIGYGIFYLIRRSRRKKRQQEELLYQQRLQQQQQASTQAQQQEESVVNDAQGSQDDATSESDRETP